MLLQALIKYRVILEAIKEVVKTIHANEYDSAKKNEQIKDGIDRKIHEEVLRLSEIKENLQDTEKEIVINDNKISIFEINKI